MQVLNRKRNLTEEQTVSGAEKKYSQHVVIFMKFSTSRSIFGSCSLYKLIFSKKSDIILKVLNKKRKSTREQSLSGVLEFFY